MKFKHKNVLVYGMSISGEWVAKLLRKCNANVFLFDDNIEVVNKKKIKNCYVLEELNENLIEQFDFLVVSPSIEKDNKHLLFAKRLNKKIYSELEFASQFCKKFVAVTGTNGKTTTTKMITSLLQTKHKAIACGNIGYPLSRAVLESKKSIKVVEVSSFMLENAETFSPQVATITNIEPDHLIRHKTMEEYSNLKKSIFKNLKQTDYAVINIDLNIKPTEETQVVTYSYSKNADVCVKNGVIWLHNQKVVSLNELKLKGKHNIYNIMCAICYAYIYKIKINKIRNVLINLQSEKFRIEKIATVNEINFVNDSKSTNIASTLASVETVKGAIILLLGGSNKDLDYKPMFNKLTKRVKQVVVFGEIANQLILANDNKLKIEKCEDLNQAFKFALTCAKPNDTILLSPATASYDQYSSYIERGKHFDNLVKDYIMENSKTVKNEIKTSKK